MIDGNGRTIDYLRVSVTECCNLRCLYCFPEGGPGVETPLPCKPLAREDILQVVEVAREFGVTHVRLTGGEPLCRRDLPEVVAGIKELGVKDLSLTTNGTLLARAAVTLAESGLDRVNVSLDSLRPDVFRRITGREGVDEVLEGVRAAIEQGLTPVKINVVMMAGLNESEVEDLADLSLRMPVSVRFIELMPIGPDPAHGAATVPLDRVKERVASLGRLSPAPEVGGAGPAEVFRLPGAPGSVGFIAPLSHPFCARCNRLRLTADGKLRPCLASDIEVDLVPVLRGRQTGPGLMEAFRRAVSLKPSGHDLWSRRGHSRRMCQIGG